MLNPQEGVKKGSQVCIRRFAASSALSIGRDSQRQQAGRVAGISQRPVLLTLKAQAGELQGGLQADCMFQLASIGEALFQVEVGLRRQAAAQAVSAPFLLQLLAIVVAPACQIGMGSGSERWMGGRVDREVRGGAGWGGLTGSSGAA